MLAVTLALVSPGCGGEARKDSAPSGPPADLNPAVEGLPVTKALPGPPGAAVAKTAADPEARRVEDRLFGTDGGRVVLASIRAHGGWEEWRKVQRIEAALRIETAPTTEKSAAKQRAPDSVAPGGAAAQSTPPPAGAGERPILLRPEKGVFADPPSTEQLLVASPFSLADPDFRLEYLGVEVDGDTGIAHNKVRVFTEGGAFWSIAYFNRYTGMLERVLLPVKPDAPKASPESQPAKPESNAAKPESRAAARERFERVDLSRQQDFAGVQLATSWTVYRLRDRFARVDPAHPSRVVELQIQVISEPSKE